MKISTGTIALLSIVNTNAFTSPNHAPVRGNTSLNTLKRKDFLATATAFLSFTTIPQTASASPSYPSTLLSTDVTLDFSLPSYNSIKDNQGGFGVGVETFSGPDPNKSEAELQKEAMRKAEAARKKRMEEKNAEIRRRDEERKKEAELKKIEGDRRVKELFGN